MRSRQPSRRAIALLERFHPDGEPLAGDLIEAFEAHPSRVWLWAQVLAALASCLFARTSEIRPLRLVDLQPADALERSRRFDMRFRPVTAAGLFGTDVGALGLAVFAGLLTIVVPAAWLVILGAALAGVLLGVVLIARRERRI